MDSSINVLLLSCGTRNKIVQYFKRELKDKGKVFATDCSYLAPALYEADEYFIVPRIDEKNYLEEVMKICKQNDINAVLSLIDPELSILAENQEQFLEIGVTPIISEKAFVEMALDKYATYLFLKNNNFPVINSYVDKKEFYNDLELDKVNFPVFIKPRTGSASININKAYSSKEVEFLFEQNDNLMIQEFMQGKEYGIDIYVDMISGELSSMFIKEKLKMRSGETDKSRSVKNDKLANLITEFINHSKFRGALDIDVFEADGEFYISEINPRFGGGYPHAYECGVNFPELVIENIKGVVNKQDLYNYKEGTFMMKYNDVIINM